MVNFSGELWPTLGYIALVVVILAAVLGIAVFRGRRRGRNAIAVDAALALSRLWMVFAVIGALLIVVKVFSADFAEFAGSTNVWIAWPEDLPCTSSGEDEAAVGAAASLSCRGGMLSAFTVVDAPLGLRALAGAAQLAMVIFFSIPAVMLGVICRQTLRGRPFTTVVARTLTWGALAVLVFGVLSDLLGGIAATVGLREVFAEESPWYPGSFQLGVSWWPFLGALGLAALAAVFRQGLALQQSNERLERETEGLV